MAFSQPQFYGTRKATYQLIEKLISPIDKERFKLVLDTMLQKQQIGLKSPSPCLNGRGLSIENFPIPLHPNVPTTHNHNVHGNRCWEALLEKDDIIKSRNSSASVRSNNIPAGESKMAIPEQVQ